MWVKICANTNLHDAQLAAELGADAVGFVFAPSKRQVNAEQVAAITKYLPATVCKVGVFATVPTQEIADTVRRAGLTAVQLHGAFEERFVLELSAILPSDVAIIQTVAYELEPAEREAADAMFTETLRSAFTCSAVTAVLVDASRAGVSGGLGVAFDWNHVGPLIGAALSDGRSHSRDRAAIQLPRLILAGGLRAENVRAAIAGIRPEGVDVASGVEARPGLKDAERMSAFLAAARAEN